MDILSNSAIMAAIIGAIIGLTKLIADLITNRWDRMQRREINSENNVLAEKFKQLEFDSVKSIKKMEITSNVKINLLRDFIISVESLNEDVCFFDGYDYSKRETKIDDDITQLERKIKTIRLRVDSSNPSANDLKNKLIDVGKAASHLSAFAKSENGSKENIDSVKTETWGLRHDLTVVGREFYEIYSKYISHYYSE